ncbi:hypothetical protein ABIE44_000691 [Marmoricola sp. OAE513]|uniref:hypothetical protein n=1 Tax=Marmoricola sp. OAE513 TaxID=2817894 RepID=UPI001AEB582D
MPTRVASANVLFKLAASAAEETLTTVLATEPDLVGLQEWYVSRAGLLRRTGDVTLVPSFGVLRLPARTPRYHWVATLGAGCVVGARSDRFDLLEGRSLLLSGLGRSERVDHPFNAEPPRIAAVGIFRDRATERTTAMISYHLVAGAQRGKSYDAGKPTLVARHLQEVSRLGALVAELQHAGHDVYATGDSNFDGFRLAGLTSSWDGREDQPGTIGRGKRKIDDVLGPGPATEVVLLRTPSDHRALMTVRET